MGDRRRFDLFADVIARNFPGMRSAPVADVAGGKGYLQMALRQRGWSDITSWDKRKGYSKGRAFYRYGHFIHDRAPGHYGLVIGMHPDGGTDQIIEYAIRRRVPFAVCPCCAIPTARPFWAKNDYPEWCAHLIAMAERGGMDVMRTELPMAGRRLVLIGRPS